MSCIMYATGCKCILYLNIRKTALMFNALFRQQTERGIAASTQPSPGSHDHLHRFNTAEHTV